MKNVILFAMFLLPLSFSNAIAADTLWGVGNQLPRVNADQLFMRLHDGLMESMKKYDEPRVGMFAGLEGTKSSSDQRKKFNRYMQEILRSLPNDSDERDYCEVNEYKSEMKGGHNQNQFNCNFARSHLPAVLSALKKKLGIPEAAYVNNVEVKPPVSSGD